jgi:hypothetical protein
MRRLSYRVCAHAECQWLLSLCWLVGKLYAQPQTKWFVQGLVVVSSAINEAVSCVNCLALVQCYERKHRTALLVTVSSVPHWCLVPLKRKLASPSSMLSKLRKWGEVCMDVQQVQRYVCI